MRPEINKR